MTQNKIGIIGGSGLDNPNILENFQEIEIDTPFGHSSGKLVCGKIGDTEVVILARHGKNHSITPTKVPYRANIWALKEAGCNYILATTACGSLQEKIAPGDFVFIDQFIDFTKHRPLTFFEDKVIHTPMAEPFSIFLREKLISVAKEQNLKYHPQGTMITIEGPRFSTKAESKLFQSWNVDVINMSTVPEVTLANEIGIPYQSIAMATDYDCWKEGEESVTLDMIYKRMRESADKVLSLIIETIKTFD